MSELINKSIKAGFIGAGKTGLSLARYFVHKGIETAGFYSRNKKDNEFVFFNSCEELAAACNVLFITVPDSAIASVWESVRECYTGTVCHCSGALCSDVFRGAKAACSVHPMLAFSNDNTDFSAMSRAFFTLEGDSAAVSTVKELLSLCNNSYCVIDKTNKAKYHAAACFASNFVVAACARAQTLLEECGFDTETARAALVPIMSENMRSICNSGALSALTGPVERNDAATVKKHLQCLDDKSADFYKAASSILLSLAKQRHADTDFSELEDIIS